MFLIVNFKIGLLMKYRDTMKIFTKTVDPVLVVLLKIATVGFEK